MKFSPCTGDCTEKGSHCEGCNRSHDEIAETREVVDQIAELASKMGYENVDEFVQFVAKKATGKARLLQMMAKT